MESTKHKKTSYEQQSKEWLDKILLKVKEIGYTSIEQNEDSFCLYIEEEEVIPIVFGIQKDYDEKTPISRIEGCFPIPIPIIGEEKVYEFVNELNLISLSKINFSSRT